MGSEQRIVDTRAEPEPRPLTVRDFLTLDEAGAFEGLGHVELVEGEVFVVAPLYFPHGRIQTELTVAVTLAARAVGLQALTPVSTRLDEHNLPEPDIQVVEGTSETFVTLAMTRIVIEVSASSIGHDLGRKKRLYARTGVPEYWVVDVHRRVIIRFHAPVGVDYANRSEFGFGDPVPSATIPDLVVDTTLLA